MNESNQSTENNNNNQEKEPPDRPLECSECKKPIAFRYTEIVGNHSIECSMCADCPVLQRRLHKASALAAHKEGEITTGLACGNCGTTLESLRVGLPVGCSACYEVFDDVLLNEIIASEKIPPRMATTKKSIPIHIGRAPGESQEINPTLRLLALNEALNETLKREDYEQAAWLRDQIKALTENPEKKDEA